MQETCLVCFLGLDDVIGRMLYVTSKSDVVIPLKHDFWKSKWNNACSFFSWIWQFLIGLDSYQKCSNDFLHCVCVCFFFFTSQISLTLSKTLLSDSLLGLVKSGAKQISSCQNQPTKHCWWANVSALSAHGECSYFFFLIPSHDVQVENGEVWTVGRPEQRFGP